MVLVSPSSVLFCILKQIGFMCHMVDVFRPKHVFIINMDIDAICFSPSSDTERSLLVFNTKSAFCVLHTLKQECFESLLSILHWSWTTLVLGVEELRGLKGFQYTATLLDLERLRFVGTCCLRLLRVYTCEIYPISGIPLNSLVSYLSANNNLQEFQNLIFLQDKL